MSQVIAGWAFVAALITSAPAASGADDPVLGAIHALRRLQSLPGMEVHAKSTEPCMALPDGAEHRDGTWRYRGASWSSVTRCTDALPADIGQRIAHPQTEADRTLLVMFAPSASSFVDGRFWWLDPRQQTAHVRKLDAHAWGIALDGGSNLLLSPISFLGWPTATRTDDAPVLWNQLGCDADIRGALHQLSHDPGTEQGGQATRIFERSIPGPASTDRISMVLSVVLSQHSDCGGAWAIDSWSWSYRGDTMLRAGTRRFDYSPMTTPDGPAPVLARVTTTVDGKVLSTIELATPTVKPFVDADLAFDTSIAHVVVDDDSGIRLLP